jgi:uncharacterized coiled-coil DUF342 family protein
MGWLDKVKQTVEKAAGGAEDMAVVGKMRLEIRTLNGKLEEAFEAIGARAYDLHEAGTTLPAEVAALCREADKIADEIKAKEQEVERIKAEA